MLIWGGAGLTAEEVRRVAFFEVSGKGVRGAFLSYGNIQSPHVNLFRPKSRPLKSRACAEVVR